MPPPRDEQLAGGSVLAALALAQARATLRQPSPAPSPGEKPSVLAQLNRARAAEVLRTRAVSAARSAPVVARGPSRERQPARRRRVSRAVASRDGPDESEPPLGRPPVTPSRTCRVCGVSLDGRYSTAATCSSACRQKSYRQRRQRNLQPSPELLDRYEAAVSHLEGLAPEERLDLLTAVVWPSDLPLVAAQLQAAA
jgi:predicted nucleic acid-binding Zn ribbon protein